MTYMLLLTDNQNSALIGAIVGGVLGIAGSTAHALIARVSRRRGLEKMLGHEVEINLRGLSKWAEGVDRPVSSNYIWNALRGEVAGLLTHKQVVALSEFYYEQAQVYKNPNWELEDIKSLINTGNATLVSLGTRV